VHESDGGVRPLPKMTGGKAQQASTTKPIQSPHEPGAKIFVHDSDGVLHHVAKCSQGTDGIVVDLQAKPANFENQEQPKSARGAGAVMNANVGGVPGSRHNHVPIDRHASPGSSEASTTAESLPSPSQSGGESGALTPPPGPSSTSSRSKGPPHVGASQVGSVRILQRTSSAPEKRRQARKVVWADLRDNGSSSEEDVLERSATIGHSASNLSATSPRLAEEPEQPHWMKGNLASGPPSGRAPSPRRLGSPPCGPAPIPVRLGSPPCGPAPIPPMQDSPGACGSTAAPEEDSSDRQFERADVIVDAPVNAGSWAKQGGKRTGRGKNKAAAVAEDTDVSVQSHPLHPTGVFDVPSPTPAQSAMVETSPRVQASPSGQPTHRSSREEARAASGKSAGKQVRRSRKAGLWRQARHALGVKVSYLRSCGRSYWKHFMTPLKASKQALDRTSRPILATSLVFLLFSLVFYVSRVGVPFASDSLTQSAPAPSPHVWQASLPSSSRSSPRADRRISTLTKQLDMESSRAVAALRSAKTTRPRVVHPSAMKMKMPKGRYDHSRASTAGSVPFRTPMERRERYESAAKAWNSWAKDAQKKLGVGKISDTGSLPGYGDLEESVGLDGMADTFADYVDESSMEEKLAFLMYLQNRQHSEYASSDDSVSEESCDSE